MDKVAFDEVDFVDNTNRVCLNIRGTNGCGKTTIAKTFIANDPDAVNIYIPGYNRDKTAMVYCPNKNLLLIGGYANKCGGCDTLVKKQVVELLTLAWLTPAHILYEGVLVANSKLPYMHLMQNLNRRQGERKFGFIYLDIPYETCLERVYARNGGKQINEELVFNKHRDAIRYRKWHEQQDGLVVVKLNADRSADQVFRAVEQAIIKVQTGLSVFSI